MRESYADILFEVDNPVAVITLNRPDRLNAWTGRMGHEVRDAIDRATDDRRVVGIIVTGAGRGFCAGADLKDAGERQAKGESPIADFGSTNRAAPRPPIGDAELPGPWGYFMSVPKPVIAAINGPAAGAGAVLALWADFRFMAHEALFTTSFSQRATVAETGTSWLLPRLVGSSAALDLLISSRRVGAEEALRMGLVNAIAPASELLEMARGYVERLARDCSPASIATMKRQVYDELHDGLAAAVKTSGALLAASIEGDDFNEGLQSFLEKRPPRFARIGTQ